LLGVIVNVITVIIGSCIGLLFKKSIPERLSTAVMTGLGACTLYIEYREAFAVRMSSL